MATGLFPEALKEVIQERAHHPGQVSGAIKYDLPVLLELLFNVYFVHTYLQYIHICVHIILKFFP